MEKEIFIGYIGEPKWENTKCEKGTFHKKWRKEDVLHLYQGLIKYGYTLQFLRYHFNNKYTEQQIKRRLKYEEKIRPQLINKTMNLKL